MSLARPAREQFAFATRIPIRWGDMDTLGHVNNAKFFTFDEQARLEYFDAVGALVPDFWKGQGIILARIACDFIAQLHYPETLEVGMRITRLGRSSMETQSAMFDSTGRLVAAGQGVLVWFNYDAQKAVAIPENVRAFIRSREVVAPSET